MRRTASNNIRIEVAGQPLELTSFYPPRKDFRYQRNEVLFGRFDFTETVDVQMRQDDPGALELYSAVAEHTEKDRGILHFQISRPGQVIILGDGLPRLILAADPAERWQCPAGALSAEAAGIIPDVSGLQCGAINAAMAGLARSGGGTLLLPEGVYPVATVRMQSNVTLHLEAGAVLRGTTDLEAYPIDPEGVLYTDLPTSLIPGPRRRVIYWENCENAALVGRGRVEGQGSELRRQTVGTVAGRPLINLMKFVHARNCRVEGVTLADPEFWNTHVLLSEGIRFDFAKVINEQPPKGWASYLGAKWDNVFWNNTDGINPDSSQGIEIQNCLLYTGDDCVAVKNTGTYRNELRDVEDIRVHHNLMHCGTTPMKVGTETRGGSIRKVHFSDNVVARCSRVCAAELKDGVTLAGLTVENIRVGECNRPFDLEILPRQDQDEQSLFSNLDGAVLRNIQIDRYRNEGRWYESHIRGRDAGHKIRNVRIENLTAGGKRFDSLDDEEVQTNAFIDGIEFA